ncbi:MAG: hypothetical protein IJK21_02415 [Prevotella sp.]|nr:hypothetical protein [Prevotella sp.]
MKAEELTIQQIERLLRKISEKFPQDDDTSILTDIHLRVAQESGEVIVVDDDEKEITRCVIEQWIDNKEENFYDEITSLLQGTMKQHRDMLDNLGILKPYSFVLEDDEGEHVSELYIADDDIVIIEGDLMQDLEEDLNSFIDNLMKE